MAKHQKGSDQFSNQEWEILVPVASGTDLARDNSVRVRGLEGSRLGLFWNTKPNGDVFLLRLSQQLQRRFKDIRTEAYLPGKPDSATGASISALQQAAEECDIVMLATGD